MPVIVIKKYLPVLDLCGHILASLRWNKEWSRWPIQKGISLASCIGFLDPITQFLEVQV